MENLEFKIVNSVTLPPKMLKEKVRRIILPKNLAFQVQQIRREIKYKKQERKERARVIASATTVAYAIALQYGCSCGYIQETCKKLNDFFYYLIH